jgi:hypothetical protein
MCVAICKLFSLVFVCLVGVNLGRKRQQHWRSFPVLLMLLTFLWVVCWWERKVDRGGLTLYFFSFSVFDRRTIHPFWACLRSLWKPQKGSRWLFF